MKVSAALRRLTVVAVLVGVLIAAGSSRAEAHPLGNFTVNRYARIELSAGVVRVYYVLDQAEIPTFQDREALEADRTGFERERLAAIGQGLRLTINDQPIALVPVTSLLTTPRGQGGLPTLRLAAIFESTIPVHAENSSLRATFADSNESERVGWRELVVTAAGDTTLSASDAPRQDLSRELRSYPGDLLQAPLDLRRASFTFEPGTEAVAASPLTSPSQAPPRAGGGFAGLITREDLTPLVLAGMLGLGLLFGAGHALAPGHGKTVMVAYLVGTRGRPADAVCLGVAVSAMHTASVLVLALALYQLDRSIAVDRIYPWLTLGSGLFVMGFGVYLVAVRARRVRNSRRIVVHGRSAPLIHATAPRAELAMVGAAQGGHDHGSLTTSTGTSHHDDGHSHDHHDAGHHHDHGAPVGHHHGGGGHHHELPPDVAPLSRRGLMVLATSGGLVPSPSAVVVLVAAFAAGRSTLGLGLVAAFSVGLAVTLTGIGLALVLGGRVLERRGIRNQRLVQLLPIGGALAIVAVGAVVVVQGIGKL